MCSLCIDIMTLLGPSYPSVLQNTKLSIALNEVLHIEPHIPLKQTSGRPSCSIIPSARRTSPSLHCLL